MSINHGYVYELCFVQAMSIAEELLTSIRTVSSFGGEDDGIQRYNSFFDKSL